jgi:hypothetical protein
MVKNEMVEKLEEANYKIAEVISGLLSYGISLRLIEDSSMGVTKFKETFDACFLQSVVDEANAVAKKVLALSKLAMMLK